LKILHINTYSTGGAATAAIRLHQALLKSGYDSKILFLKGSGTIHNAYYWDITEKVIYKKSLLIRLSEKIKRIVKEILPYRFQPKRKNENLKMPDVEIFTSPISEFSIEEHPLVKEADVVQLHWVADFINWKSFFLKINKPVFWYFHDMNPILGGAHYSDDLVKIRGTEIQNRENNFNRIKEDALEKVINLSVQCDSDWLTKETLNSGRFLNANNVETIHYSLDFDIFYPLEKDMVKEILGINLDYTVILFGCENLKNRRKGLDLLLEAINSIKEKEKIILCTFGNGLDLLSEIGDDFIIKNFGKINNLDLHRIIYSVADFFIIPSRQEAFGQTALESLACGTPVIGFNTGGIPDIIENEVNGLLVYEITSKDLKDSIVRLIEDKELLDRLTQASRKSVEMKFSQEKQVEAFIKRYSEQLNKKNF